MNRSLSILLGFAATFSVFAQSDSTTEQWIEDIEFFDAYVREHHPNVFAKADEDEWDARIAALKDDIDELSPSHIPLRFQRIMALVQDGHSYLNWATVGDELHAAPLVLTRFSDGVFVTRALQGHEDLVGARIEAVGGVPIDDLARKTLPFACEDNMFAAAKQLAWHCVQRETLKLVGAAEAGEPIQYTIAMSDGTVREVSMDTLSLNARAEAFNALPPEDLSNAPLYRQRPDENYWETLLPESGALYIKFSKVRGTRGKPFALWTRKMMKELEGQPIPYAIVDVRFNGGGDGSTLRPLIERLAESRWGQEQGRLYIITSPTTFSAAMMFVTRMERATQVRFAGEPAGGRPNHYGDNEPFELPNSKLGFRLSSLYHEESDPDDTREFQEVHVPAPLSSRDYFANHDPVLEAIHRDHLTFFPEK